MTPVSSLVSNCSLTAAEPRSNGTTRPERVGNDDSPKILGETREYIHDFERPCHADDDPVETISQMLKLYPDRINRGASGVQSVHKTYWSVRAFARSQLFRFHAPKASLVRFKSIIKDVTTLHGRIR